MVQKPNRNEGKSPIVQGLAYLVDGGEIRPSPADTLVITAAAASRPDAILAGAQFPIARARFPLQFNMYDENVVLPTQLQSDSSSKPSSRGGRRGEVWYQATQDEDVIVTARVCPEDAVILPCADSESSFRAKGLCKLLRGLPGMKEGQVVRTPASLALE